MSEINRKVRVGTVVSTKMLHTVVVSVEWRQRHRLYQKRVRRFSKFNAHDEGGSCGVGDQVRITETRPLSKTKRWRITEILQRRDVPELKPAEITIPTEEPQG